MSKNPESPASSCSTFITQKGESVLELAGIWNNSGNCFFALEQRSGSRESGTSASLIITRYNKACEIEKTRDIALFKRHREAEATAKLISVGNKALLVVLGGSQLESLTLGDAVLVENQNTFQGLLVSFNLDKI